VVQAKVKVAVVACGLWMLTSALASAQSVPGPADWTVRRVDGTVLHDVDGKPGSAVKEGETFSRGMSLRTGTDGQVTLQHDRSSIVVRENSIVSLLDGSPGGGSRFLVHWGVVDANVEAAAGTLDVETPTLFGHAANATFELRVGTTSSDVRVKGGSLNVVSAATLEELPIGAGETAVVSSELEPIAARKPVAEVRKRTKRSKSFLESLAAFPSKALGGLSK